MTVDEAMGDWSRRSWCLEVSMVATATQPHPCTCKAGRSKQFKTCRVLEGSFERRTKTEALAKRPFAADEWRRAAIANLKRTRLGALATS
ncbi:hypothetical protein EVAR_45624_1 [Eumeta japonica]|uniref:Uncharacterized protein n=1 Tax=Eumeta variegata TaxID=151549 RepID=A0A4C1WGP6_EUMVA|nr:hypothetical protein EVAR_45624_1 [Eumeta japonica]